MTTLNVIKLLVLCVCLEECWSRQLTVFDLVDCLANCNGRGWRCKNDCHNRMKPVYAPCRDSCLSKWYGCMASCDKLGGDKMMWEAGHACKGYLKLCVNRCPKGATGFPKRKMVPYEEFKIKSIKDTS